MLKCEPKQFRENVVKKFSKYINSNITCKNIETAILNYTILECRSKKIIAKWDNYVFVSIYKNKLKSIWNNLINDKTSLIEKLNSRDIKAKELKDMTHQEMYPEHWKVLLEEKMKRDTNKYQVDKRGATSEFKCKKCKQRECTYYQLQTRSADEPMTTFVTCLNCGNNWKF
jgi:DNA-directed RNA polymerase subunit M/transcription elongation factor TFIIS